MEGQNDQREASAFYRTILYGVLSAAAFIVTAPVLGASSVTIGGPFSLIAPDGSTVTDASFRGKWMLVFFGYTYCPTICPTTLSEIALALERLGPDAAKVQPVFITVDPERDTPEVMGQYTGAIDPRIVGLSGSQRQIAAVSEEYGAYSERHTSATSSDDYVVDHSTYIYVMDPQGSFVRGLQAGTPADTIADTLRRLMTKAGQ
ncbi:SCO family protein [Sinorhizobium sp. NFACC03]|uniref:SCO family protein n=1 Tax=Sinorhizobium sp. NFACC03 TaxID=1566295 RepID=UPI000889FE43|nr:SCO family protein [Sinorhizobium sp. NFACC03]SDA99732.1 protein SCO1/2 [Sinorhizobium sp. NFACC03]